MQRGGEVTIEKGIWSASRKKTEANDSTVSGENKKLGMPSSKRGWLERKFMISNPRIRRKETDQKTKKKLTEGWGFVLVEKDRLIDNHAGKRSPPPSERHQHIHETSTKKRRVEKRKTDGAGGEKGVEKLGGKEGKRISSLNQM